MKLGSITLLSLAGVSLLWARNSQGQAGQSRPVDGGAPVTFAACDYDNDGKLDHLVFGPASPARLLANLGSGRTEDRTVEAMLDTLGLLSQAFWRDLDGDRWQDLIVVTPEGALRLFTGDGRAFVETTEELGVLPCGSVRALDFEDTDQNGWLDIRVECADGGPMMLFGSGGHLWVPGEDPMAFLRSGMGGGGGASLGSCATSIQDQASPSNCLTASSTPTIGRLYLMGSDLRVSGGTVCIDSSTPDLSSALDVNGIIRARQGIRLPDGSLLTGAIPAGGEGPEGPMGPEGPAGPPGPSVPTGTILMTGSTSAPAGFLLCDGAEYLESEYPDLYVAISTTYGGVPGVSFNVPDLRQRFAMGADDSVVDTELGDNGGSLDHTHDIPAHGHGLGSLAVGSGGAHNHGVTSLTVGGAGNHTHSGVTGDSLADGSVGIRFVTRGVVSAGGTDRRMLGYPNTGPDIQYTGADGQATVAGTNHNHGFSIASSGSHTHTIGGSLTAASDHTHSINGSVGNIGAGNGDGTSLVSGANEAGSAVDRNPPFVTVNYIIKF